MIFSNKKDRGAEQEQRDRVVLYKKVFGSPEGKLVFIDLLNRFCINEHPEDKDKANRAEGRRSAVLYIQSQCKMNLEEFDRLLSGDVEGARF